jgi:hypothetical protein
MADEPSDHPRMSEAEARALLAEVKAQIEAARAKVRAHNAAPRPGEHVGSNDNRPQKR